MESTEITLSSSRFSAATPQTPSPGSSTSLSHPHTAGLSSPRTPTPTRNGARSSTTTGPSLRTGRTPCSSCPSASLSGSPDPVCVGSRCRSGFSAPVRISFSPKQFLNLFPFSLLAFKFRLSHGYTRLHNVIDYLF